jgi:hypothetical protein
LTSVPKSIEKLKDKIQQIDFRGNPLIKSGHGNVLGIEGLKRIFESKVLVTD